MTEKPRAKAKLKQERLGKEEEAIKKFDAETIKPRKRESVETVKHRNDVSTGEVLNILADVVEDYVEEYGGAISRLDAREFYAMNIWRHLRINKGISAREQKVPFVLCKEHDV